MNSFTIKDLANLSGIKAHTIRIWEQRYNFLKPRRTDTNIRLYNNDELRTLLNIALLNKYGYKISHIDKMSEQQVRQNILALTQNEAQQERIINELIRFMIELDMESFEELLQDYIYRRGIEKTITTIIFPYLEKIGILWLTNHINPAQEHLVSNIIRQKIIAGIEKLKTPATTSKKVLLFLPEGEHHELGLLFLHFMLKAQGANVIYLGASIPMKDVAFVVQNKKPDYLFCHLTSIGQNFHFDRFLQQLTLTFKDAPIIISGLLARSYQKKINPPIIFKRTYSEVTDFIFTL
jgi:MerR family transcriptional regulator, light-induced transcriptional regulator